MLLEPGGEPDAWAVLDDLDTLVDRSLVTLSPSGDDDEPRYRLLETPRAYALERLERTGEREAMRRRHAFAVAALFDAAYDEYFSGRIGIDEWLRRCEADFDNARDALHWACAAGETDIALGIGATMLRALPSSLHVERMALADACEAGIVPSAPEQVAMPLPRLNSERRSSNRCSARATSTTWHSRASTCSRRCWRWTPWRSPVRSRRPRGPRPRCSTWSTRSRPTWRCSPRSTPGPAPP